MSLKAHEVPFAFYKGVKKIAPWKIHPRTIPPTLTLIQTLALTQEVICWDAIFPGSIFWRQFSGHPIKGGSFRIKVLLGGEN